MSFTTLTPSAPPSRRGGVSIRLARPTRGTFTHVEARFFIERPLAIEVGMAPGDRCSVAVGEGADAGWLRIAHDEAGAFTFGRSGGAKGGGCVVSIGHTERFGRTPGHHRVDRTLVRASHGTLLIPLPPELRGGQQQEEQAPGSADLEPGEGEEGRAPAAAPAAQEAAPAPARQPTKPLPGFRIGQDNGAKGRATAAKAPPPTAPQPEDERIRKLFDPEKDQGAGYVAAALNWPLPRVTQRLKDLGLVRAG